MVAPSALIFLHKKEYTHMTSNVRCDEKMRDVVKDAVSKSLPISDCLIVVVVIYNI